MTAIGYARVSTADQNPALQMYDSHTYTVAQIAKTLGVSRSTIYQHLDRAAA